MGTPVVVIDDGTGDRTLPVADLVAHGDRIDDVSSRLPDRSGPALPVAAVLSTDLPFVTVASTDGRYTASIPTSELVAGGLLLLEDPGGPVRLVVAEGSTLCWNVKQVGSLRATPERVPDSVPENPPH
jgi:hypothetical protein